MTPANCPRCNQLGGQAGRFDHTRWCPRCERWYDARRSAPIYGAHLTADEREERMCEIQREMWNSRTGMDRYWELKEQLDDLTELERLDDSMGR